MKYSGPSTALAISPETMRAMDNTKKVFLEGLLNKIFHRIKESKNDPPMIKRCMEDQAKYPNVIPHKTPKENFGVENIFRVISPKRGIRKNGQNTICKE